ncbi:hypothetical protein MPNT_30096 [Candidatus Methylacidithermus pantelleriae]|uniref:Uncharacterized protein n=1 Tax=Candidatus Methylacidithermus pantelleriae TaxID=2744239 RepID=A0A8J2BPH0_9BACT|nr:hypothetical protein MPNT_30096 [Candidatus Methylacidithermus pantelleriae]
MTQKGVNPEKKSFLGQAYPLSRVGRRRWGLAKGKRDFANLQKTLQELTGS